MSSHAIQPTWVPFHSTLSSEQKLLFSLRLMNGRFGVSSSGVGAGLAAPGPCPHVGFLAWKQGGTRSSQLPFQMTGAPRGPLLCSSWGRSSACRRVSAWGTTHL